MEMTCFVASSVRPTSEIAEREKLFLDALPSGALLIDPEGKITVAKVVTSGLPCRSARRAIPIFTRMPNRSWILAALKDSEKPTFRATELAC
jgi:hypothetical protein